MCVLRGFWGVWGLGMFLGRGKRSTGGFVPPPSPTHCGVSRACSAPGNSGIPESSRTEGQGGSGIYAGNDKTVSGQFCASFSGSSRPHLHLDGVGLLLPGKGRAGKAGRAPAPGAGVAGPAQERRNLSVPVILAHSVSSWGSRELQLCNPTPPATQARPRAGSCPQ